MPNGSQGQSHPGVAMQTATLYPIMFTFRDTVSGNGFLAGVTITGRSLMIKEDDGKWWMYGVRPASIADFGDTPGEAFRAFRNSFKEVLFDIADVAQEFKEFNDNVEQFFYEPDNVEEGRWNTAYCLLRDGKVQPESPFLSELPKQDPSSRPTTLSIIRLDDVVNKPPRYMPTDKCPRLVFFGYGCISFDQIQVD